MRSGLSGRSPLRQARAHALPVPSRTGSECRPGSGCAARHAHSVRTRFAAILPTAPCTPPAVRVGAVPAQSHSDGLHPRCVAAPWASVQYWGLGMRWVSYRFWVDGHFLRLRFMLALRLRDAVSSWSCGPRLLVISPGRKALILLWPRLRSGPVACAWWLRRSRVYPSERGICPMA